MFLDLYDNLITDISGLEGLHALRVLMLGRNRFFYFLLKEETKQLSI